MAKTKTKVKELQAEEVITQEGKQHGASGEELQNKWGDISKKQLATPGLNEISFEWEGMKEVESSNISKIGFFYHDHPEDNVDVGVIAVTFKSNPRKVYLYEDQDYAMFQQLKTTASHGKWVNDNLKKNHIPVIAHEV